MDNITIKSILSKQGFTVFKGCDDRYDRLFLQTDEDPTWAHYIHTLQTVYLSEIVDSDIESCIISNDLDCGGFWAETNKPNEELKQRLLDFQVIVLDCYKDKSKYLGSPSLDYIPTDNEVIAHAWASHYIELDVPSDFIEAKVYIESIMYKYRKMCELYSTYKDYIHLLD